MGKELFDLRDPNLAVYSSLSENQLKHFYEPKPGLFICESPKVIRRALAAGYEPVSLLMESKYLDNEDRDILETVQNILKKKMGEGCPKPPVYLMPAEKMSQLTGYFLTGGMLCAMRRKVLPLAEDFLSELCRRSAQHTDSDTTKTKAGSNAETARVRIAILDNIENPTNVGAIFRSAAAMKLDGVLLTGGNADPLYRRAARVSVGTVFQIPWTVFSKPADARNGNASASPKHSSCLSDNYIDLLHAQGFQVAALALSDNSVSIEDPKLKQIDRLAIILGNEGDGLRSETLAACDYVVKIPMAAGIDSLNVAAASAVAFWELRG